MARNQKIAEKRTELRKRIFPDVVETDLWLRSKSTGFTTIPRCLPLLLNLMDRLSKGKPVSGTYFELWCRMFDECFLNLKPREMAFHAGFSGQRAEQTWAERVKILERLGFIKTQPGPEGDLSFAVVLNPYKVMKRHFKMKASGLDIASFHALIQRANEIGAKDMDDPPAQEPAATIAEQPKTNAGKPSHLPPRKPPDGIIAPAIAKQRK
jgi:hypothetical protein